MQSIRSTQSILSLARAGATSRAWEAFAAAGLDKADDDVEALTLKGRLLKDGARRAARAERAALFAQAGAAYERAATLRPDSYPLINASAMALFAGDRVRAELLASKVLHLVESGADRGETPYWGEATRAEALLLLGRTADARSSLARAIALAPRAWEDHAATLRQFALVLAQTGGNAEWLDPLRPPSVLHFNGILGIAPDDLSAADAIGAEIATIAPGFGFGAIAAGADIIAAEKLLESGAELHIVLPSDPADFRHTSVDPYDPDWLPRFTTLLESAHSVTICGHGETTSMASVMLAEYHAMGLAAEKAAQLETRAVALRIEPMGRPSLGDPWLESGRALHHVAVESYNVIGQEPLSAGQLLFDVAIDGLNPGTFAMLPDALEALRAAEGEIAALDCRTGGNIRVRSLLAQGEPGMIVTSRDAALALLASGSAERVETVGEMASSEGPIEICLAMLSGYGTR